MSTQNIRTGQNVVVVQDHPDRNYSDPKFPQVRLNEVRTLLLIPFPNLRDKVVTSAVLSVPLETGAGAQMISVQALASRWDVDKVTWNKQPGVVGVVATEVLPITAAGTRIEIDVNAIAQAIANGQKNHGLRISSSTNAGVKFKGFRSGNRSWRLVINTSDEVETPESLVPDGVISVGKWVAQLNDYDEVVAIQVQVDPGQDEVAPDFDSGELAATTALLDLNTTAYPGLANAATTHWRGRVRQADDGQWSEWSDWATVTRHNKPTLIIDNPEDGELWDSSPVVVAHLSAGTIEQWRLTVAKADDPAVLRYDSGGKDGDGLGEIEWQIPMWDYKGTNLIVMPEDGDYVFTWKVWDRTDRVASQGDPPYVVVTQTVTLATDNAVLPATDLTVSDANEGRPGITLQWQRAASPDEFVILRDGRQVFRADHEDLLVEGGLWEWMDLGATPNRPTQYTVRAITNARQSQDSEALEVFDVVDGLWLLSEHGEVKLIGKGIENVKMIDRRARYQLPGRRDQVDIITAFGGYEGQITAELNGIRGDQDADAALAVLEAMKFDALAEVQLVMVDLSIPVLLRDLTWSPHPDSIPKAGRARYKVEFEFFQSSGFYADGLDTSHA